MSPIILIANGDLRLSANRVCWPAQQQTEEAFIAAVRSEFGEGLEVRRGHPFDPVKGHGFIDSQSHGLRIFREIPRDAPLVVVEAVWQYSQHILGGLIDHKGPILTVANWSGQWPGLVGMLNLNGSLTKAGVQYSTLWSVDFKDDFFLRGLRRWLSGEQLVHDRSHARALETFAIPAEVASIGIDLARRLKREKTIIGVFDEGCMGMYNAIIPDELLSPLGVYKERLSQSALYAAMLRVSDHEAAAVRTWLEKRGMKFITGPAHETDLTDAQIAQQCRMYVAAVRIAADYGCEAIGIQYQQGLKDLCAASDLAEGLLNNVDRPPVSAVNSREPLFAGKAVVHFNEVDECAGLDALITNRVWTKLGFDPETTLHDVRWGEDYRGESGSADYVWVFLISGAVPAKHLIGEYAGADSVRQPPMYFPNGGGTLRGVSKPGELVWSRIFVEGGALRADIGRAKAIALPAEETKRRWEATTVQWPIMHAVLYGVTRDQFMGRHRSNHIQVAYAPDAAGANRALAAKAATFRELGIAVSVCGGDHGLAEQ